MVKSFKLVTVPKDPTDHEYDSAIDKMKDVLKRG